MSQDDYYAEKYGRPMAYIFDMLDKCRSIALPSREAKSVVIGGRYNPVPHQMRDAHTGAYLAVNMPLTGDDKRLQHALLLHDKERRSARRWFYKLGG